MLDRMRLWLKDSERRPDPAPLKTDDRKPLLTGLALWLVGLVAVLLLVPGNPGLFWTCIVGLVLGLVGLVYVHRWR